MNLIHRLWSIQFFTVSLLGLTLLLAACSKEEAPPAPDVVRPVKVQVVGDGDNLQRSMPGTTRADKRVELAFQVSGPVNKLPIEEGQEIKKGAIVAQILPRDFETSVRAAKASAVEAEQQYGRYKGLYARNQVSKAQFDKAQSQFDISRANLKKAEDALADTTLRAPFAGVVAKRYVENFQEVRAKDPIISLQDQSRIEVLIDVPERLMAQARDKTSNVNMFAQFAVAPGKEFPLKLKEIAAQADPRTQTYQVVLVMDQPSELNVLPGMTATVIIKIGTKSKKVQKLVIPAIAVTGSPTEGSFVWVVAKDNQISKRQVTTGTLLSNGGIQIDSGLEPGETVAISGVSLLREGMEVRPVTEVSY